MEQIQQHEYDNTGWGVLKCTHCGCYITKDLMYGVSYYHLANDVQVDKEPDCITRKKQEHGTDTTT